MSRGRWTALMGLCFFCALSFQALGQTVAFVDAAGQPASVYLESTRVYVRVVDPGANHDNAVPESVTVQLTTAVWSRSPTRPRTATAARRPRRLQSTSFP